MHPYRITMLLMTCGLVLGGFASPAAAKTIVVTTNQDVVDPPFNTGGLCGNGTGANLPGADGKVSLREAVIAANNTPGQKTIKFNLPPSDRTIVLTLGSLFLCGGHTTLNGDVDGNNSPDITLDGRAILPDFDVLDIFSSHNTVKSLRVLAPSTAGVAGIAISPTPAVSTTVRDNTITHNIVMGGAILVNAGFDLANSGQTFNGATIKHVTVRDNTVSGSPFPLPGVLILNNGNHHEVTDLIIAKNTLSENPTGIWVLGGVPDFTDDGASDNRVEVTIRDNLITGNSNPGDTAGILILGGSFKSARNHVSVQLLNNTVTDNTGIGIATIAGAEEGGTDNRLTVQARGNRVENNTGVGILAFGGEFGATDGHLDLTLTDNLITGNQNPGDTAGIALVGGFFSSSNNQVSAQLLHNTLTNNNGNGIAVGSGNENSSDNDVAVTIRDNTLENNAGAGIVTFGAAGALFSSSGDSSGNTLDARIEHNTVTNAFVFGIGVYGGLGGVDGAVDKVADNNEVTAVVKDNTVTDTFGEGIHVAAGSAGEANDNDVDVTVKKNTVCGSSATDIHAIGGLLGNPFLPDNLGTGNEVEGEITKNIADTVVVENGVIGNTAQVTQSKNVPCL